MTFKLISDSEIWDGFVKGVAEWRSSPPDTGVDDEACKLRGVAQARLASCEKEHEVWKSPQEVEQLEKQQEAEYFRGYELGYENGKKDSTNNIEQIKREARKEVVEIINWAERNTFLFWADKLVWKNKLKEWGIEEK